MGELHESIQASYTQLRQEAADGDPQKAGHGGEGVWAELLEQWLPPGYIVETRKYIVLEDGTETGETDIVVLRPSCPPGMRPGKKHKVLAGVVAAAFSVKTTLHGNEIAAEVERGVRLKQGLRAREGSPQAEILPAFPYGILAHSHQWKSTRPQKPPVDHISHRLLEAQDVRVKHPRELVDFVCVADTAFWATQRVTYMGPHLVGAGFKFATPAQEQNGVALTATVCTEPIRTLPKSYQMPGLTTVGSQIGPTIEGYNPPPVAAFITALLTRLSYQDTNLAPIAESFRINGNIGMMNGPNRLWDAAEVYSGNMFQTLPQRSFAVLM